MIYSAAICMSASASAQAISNGNGASRARPSAIARALARTDRNPQSTSTTAKPWRKRPPRALSHSRRAIHINTGLRTNPLPTRGTTAARKSPLSLGFLWAGQQDSTLRPAVPKTAALPGCAIPRRSRLVDTWFAPASQAACRRCVRSLAFAENRTDDPVARLDAELAGRPGDHFEHRAHRSAGRNEAIGFRLGAVFDAHDPAITANEEHIQRDVGIVHPERDRLVMLEVEQHALAFRQLPAEHQAALAFRVIGDNLDGKSVDAGGADDLDCVLLGRLRRARKSEGYISADKKCRGKAPRPWQGRCKQG